jgi:hypothetical protein
VWGRHPDELELMPGFDPRWLIDMMALAMLESEEQAEAYEKAKHG